MNCQICGDLVSASQTSCGNCGSSIAGVTGNPYTSSKLFTTGISVVVAALGVISLALGGTVAVTGAGAAASLIAGAQHNFGNFGAQDDTSSLLPDTGFSKQGGTDSGDGTDSAVDPSDSSGIPADLVAQGYVLGDDSALAWRWATEGEKASMDCTSESTTCTWVSVYAIQACPAVLINGHVSLDSSTDTAEETIVATSEMNSADAGASTDLYLGEERLIELDGYDDYTDQDTWMFVTSMTCEFNGIGHD